MTTYLEAVPRSGPRTSGAKSLAGSAQIWFDDVRRYGQRDGLTLAGDLPSSEEERLCRQRPDICGLTMDRPRIMAILNVTPDSFSDGGDLVSVDSVVERARDMAADADILDLGGESTRPGADTVPIDAEIKRVVPAIEAIRRAGLTTPISVDTRKAPVAEAALDAGADMVNDVSAMSFDGAMAPLVAARDVPICLMHAQGDPKTMQEAPTYGDVVAEVAAYLDTRIQSAIQHGIDRRNIIVDPGIGFGKTLQHNVSLLRHLSVYHDFGVPILLGASRKRFIGTIGGGDAPKDRMPGSIAVALHAAMHGVQIIRVHDVRETRQAMHLHLAINESE